MANRLPWAARKTSQAWSVFRPHLNTDPTLIHETGKIFQLHYGTVNQSPSQQICKCLATGGIVLCMQYKNEAARLYRGNGHDVSDDIAILSDKN
jgi:hypothetical protein